MSNIEWTDETWNPVTGCTKVSPGCAHCYIERQTPMRIAGRKFVRGAIPVRLHPERLDAPLHWKAPRRIFVNSMSDLFHEDVPDEFIDRVFAVMALTGGERFLCAAGRRCEHNDSPGCYHEGGGVRMGVHTFQILTKRPARMKAYIDSRTEWRQGIMDALNDPEWSMSYEDPDLIVAPLGWPLPNVWLGVSVENQHWADERIPLLLQTPAAVRFISAEPMLGPVDLCPHLLRGLRREPSCWLCGDQPRLDWIIVGGESGHARRPLDLAWARSIRDQCRAAGVAFFMKQLGGSKAGTALEDLPEDLRIREFPSGGTVPGLAARYGTGDET